MIYVSAGHHQEHPGVFYKGFYEYVEASKWVSIIANHLGHDAMVVPSGPIKSKVEFINERYLLNDIAIEIHFNSDMVDGIHTGKGCETLYCPDDQRGNDIADRLQYNLSSIIKPDNGICLGWYQRDKAKGLDFFLAKTVCTSLIIVPDYIHRKAKIEGKRDLACKEISNTLIDIILGEEFKNE